MNTDENAPHKRVLRQIKEQSRQQWQPIETAPKDGTEVVVVDIDGDRFIASSTDGQNWYDGAYPVDYPSHWMALPTPPKP